MKKVPLQSITYSLSFNLNASDCFLEIAFLDALCAKPYLTALTVLNDTNCLQIRQPFPLAFIIGVADVIANLLSLSAYLADPCHADLLT